MFADIFKIVFLVCWGIYFFFLYAPHLRQIKKDRVADDRKGGLELPLSLLAFLGMQVIPLIYIFSSWLDFADYSLPAWAGWLGAAIFALSLWLTWKSHADLGRNWSPTLQIKSEHTLITQGIYRNLRHPIYAAQWLWAIAQALLLHNWIAGLAGLATFLPIYLYRVPREEQMMEETFGEAYRAYKDRTGGIIPRRQVKT
jgi:protein-S-isoprenylcysteine O-methyltransferase Ste14